MSILGIILLSIYGVGYFFALPPIVRFFRDDDDAGAGTLALLYAFGWPVIIVVKIIAFIGKTLERIVP